MLKFSIRLVRTSHCNYFRWINTDAKLIQGSLTLRFHEYLNKPSDTQPSSRIAAIHEIFSNTNIQQQAEIRKIDRTMQRNKMDTHEIFKCFEYAARYMPNQVLNLKFYGGAIKKLLENQQTCRKEFIKLCFYIGFFKKNQPGPQYLRNLLENHLDALLMLENVFTTTDLAIISISSYKTSVRIKSKLFHERIIKEILEMNDIDEFMLVAFVKTLKHNQIHSAQVLEKLNEIIIKSDLTHEPLVHILPYITEHDSNSSMIKVICAKCISSFNEQSRVKDIQKFLHSCALLNLKLNKQELDKLEDMVLHGTNSEEFRNHFDHFINATLSLWILNHHSRRLITLLFKDERFYKTGPYSRIKLDSRMKLLKTCVEVERPEWIRQSFKANSFHANRPAPLYLIKNSLEKVMNSDELRDKKAVFVQQFSNLNIAGILATSRNGKVTHYEVLDEQTTLADKRRPNGIFQLKRRLLEKKNCDYRIVSVL